MTQQAVWNTLQVPPRGPEYLPNSASDTSELAALMRSMNTTARQIDAAARAPDEYVCPPCEELDGPSPKALAMTVHRYLTHTLLTDDTYPAMAARARQYEPELRALQEKDIRDHLSSLLLRATWQLGEYYLANSTAGHLAWRAGSYSSPFKNILAVVVPKRRRMQGVMRHVLLNAKAPGLDPQTQEDAILQGVV